MRIKLVYIFICYLIIFGCAQSSWASNTFKSNISQSSQIIKRKLSWPDWKMPSPLRLPNLKDDLIFPNWFEGTWDVVNSIAGEDEEESIKHIAKFFVDSTDRIVADREYNTNSYAINSKEKEFLFVKNDPNSPNRQFAKLTNDRFLESKIIGRKQEGINEDIFLTDELVLEILHTQNFARVSQVETLTEFRKCNLEDKNNFNICGEQFQAIYKEPGQNNNLFPVKTEKFNLILSKTHYD